MTMPFEHAFRPGRIGALHLPHRVLMGSMHLGLESDPEALAAFYVERVEGGAAMIITGGSAVSRAGAAGRNYSFINDPEDEGKLRDVARAVHGAGGRMALQLFHAGRYARQQDFGLQPLAPSAIASRFEKSPPRAMTVGDIAATIADFALGAARARALGFDAVEIMGSEGYLLNQFLSPITNRRDDEWGGDFARRTRFPLAVLSSVRGAVGVDYPIIYRASAADLMPDSTSDEETRAFVRLLVEYGADAIDVGVGWHESSTPTVQFTVPPGAWVRYAEEIADAASGVPVIAGTRINTIELADRVLANGKVEFVALARGFLADPAIVRKSRTGNGSVNICIACNQACIDRSLRDEPVSCMVNTRAGSELRFREDTPSAGCGSFAVVGGGPAGLEAARVLGALRQRVVLYEAAGALGGQFRLASRIPGKAAYARTIAYFQEELQRLGVEIRLRQPVDALSGDELEQYDGVIVATGVVPRKIDLPGTGLPLVLSYPEAVAGIDAVRDPVAIIGAGGIGVDIAHLMSDSGRCVSLLCRGDVVGKRIGRSTRWVILQALRSRSVQILTEVSFLRITTEGVWLRGQSGSPRLIEARTVIIAVGQESCNHLSLTLQRLGRPHRVVGGARSAGELDGVRAFREGAYAAHSLLSTRNGSHPS
jgi:2,4-dienoyl-CoA reductase (NADPH2)